VLPLREILRVLRDAYSRTVGIEYMHIQEPDQKEWIQERIEGTHPDPPPEEKHRILERLNAAEAFERFLHTKYLGQKRFSLEGAETLIPMLDALFERRGRLGHDRRRPRHDPRGRLNALANVLGKSYETDSPASSRASWILRALRASAPAATGASGRAQWYFTSPEP